MKRFLYWCEVLLQVLFTKLRHLTRTTNKRVYIGHALTDAPDEVAEIGLLLENYLSERGYTRLHFYGLDKVEGSEPIVRHDSLGVVSADWTLFLTGWNSMGMAVEIALRCIFRLPCALLHPKGKRLTRMVSGLTLWNPYLEIYEYNGDDEMVAWAAIAVRYEY